MDWMFFIKNRFWWITYAGASILRTPPNWKRAREICAAFSYKCLQSLFALYVICKQIRQYGRQQQWALSISSCTVTAEEKQELYQRIEALECTVDAPDSPGMSEERIAELESQVTHLQQEIHQRVGVLEVSLNGPDVSEERLAELAGQVVDLQQETHQRLEVLEGSLSRSSVSEEHLGKLENHVAYFQQEIYQRIEAFEGTMQGLGALEERLARIESQVTGFQQEVHQRVETLEGALKGLSASEKRFVELEGSITHLQQEIGRRIEALEGSLSESGVSEERLAELESQVTRLQQMSQAPGLSKPVVASLEERKPTLLTARSFAARHKVDWNQMQAWIDTQVLTPALSAEGLSDYLFTPDQQSMLIRYWKSRKIPYAPCEQCPHYVLFGSQTRLA